mmetsp:Transcript_14502/g.30096  ORF Transcript_14502/g.30096 Transcript_14502/m.30096 type:complete len:309 (-) Transcript_14502:659-1585(-)
MQKGYRILRLFEQYRVCFPISLPVRCLVVLAIATHSLTASIPRCAGRGLLRPRRRASCDRRNPRPRNGGGSGWRAVFLFCSAAAAACRSRVARTPPRLGTCPCVRRHQNPLPTSATGGDRSVCPGGDKTASSPRMPRGVSAGVLPRPLALRLRRSTRGRRRGCVLSRRNRGERSLSDRDRRRCCCFDRNSLVSLGAPHRAISFPFPLPLSCDETELLPSRGGTPPLMAQSLVHGTEQVQRVSRQQQLLGSTRTEATFDLGAVVVAAVGVVGALAWWNPLPIKTVDRTRASFGTVPNPTRQDITRYRTH